MDYVSRRPGKFLVALDRIDEMDARRKMLMEAYRRNGTKPARIEAIHTKNCTGVGRAIRDWPKANHDEDRVVLFITHAALQGSDLSAYRGWVLIIDEVPAIWFTDHLKTPASWDWFDRNYTLTSSPDTKWSQITPKAVAPTVARVKEDTIAADLTVLVSRIRDRVSGVYADIKSWKDTAKGGAQAKGWSWFAIWSPECLRVFSRVILLGNSIPETLLFKLWNEWYAGMVEWKEISLKNDRAFKPRRVVVEYYSERQATAKYFEDFPEMLEVVAKHINATADTTDHFWSCNVKTLTKTKFRLNGYHVNPRACGRNDLLELSQGSFIYSAKPRPEEVGVLDLFKITQAMVVRAREYEDILQMFGRCSIRDPDDERDIIFRVFSQDQAEIIAEHYRATEHTFKLRHVDLSLPGQDGGVTGRPSLIGTRPLTDTERKAAQRWRNRMTAAGVDDVRLLSQATDKLTDEMITVINTTFAKHAAAAASV
jgi:hypothetical protein